MNARSYIQTAETPEGHSEKLYSSLTASVNAGYLRFCAKRGLNPQEYQQRGKPGRKRKDAE